MNWNHLYCFYEVARNKSIKDASSQMGLASSTVSEQVKKLEDSFGVELFARKGREMILTDEGEHVFSYAKDMFDKGKRLVDSLEFNEIAGYSVKVSIEAHLENKTIDEFMKNYWKSYSSFGLVETRRSKNLSQSIYFLEHDVVDWMITSSDLSDTRFDRLKLGQVDYSFYCSERLYKKYRDKKDILKRTPLGRFATVEKIEEDIKSYFLDISVSPKEQFHSDHVDFLIELCLDSEIVLFMPSFTDYIPKGLRKIEFSQKFETSIFAMFKKTNSQLLYIRKLRELLSDLNIQEEDRTGQLPYFNFNTWRPIDDKLN